MVQTRPLWKKLPKLHPNLTLPSHPEPTIVYLPMDKEQTKKEISPMRIV